MNRRKFLSYVGCGCCGFILNSCSTAPITERKQFKIIPEAKLNAQSIIAEAETEAKGIVAVEINQARTDAASLIELTNKELEAQKKLALQKLETQIDELSQLIKEKLIGKQAAL